MSTIKSSAEDLTLNADGSGNDIKFQSDGVEKASIDSSGAFTSTTIDATALTGNLPAIDGSSLTALDATALTGNLPAIDGSNLTGISSGGTITALNNATENELVTVGATTTELDAESNLTFDGAEGILTVTSSEPRIYLADIDANASGYAKIRGGASGAVFLEADPTDAEINSHITFKVDSTQMGRFTSDGLCFNSDSATANALDDYEEGIWYPVIKNEAGTHSATPHVSFTEGGYIKIGKIVYVSGMIATSSLGSVSGRIALYGLPFAVHNGWTGYGAVAVSSASGLAISAGQNVGLRPVAGMSYCDIVVWDSTAGTSYMDASEWSANGGIALGGTYLAA